MPKKAGIQTRWLADASTAERSHASVCIAPVCLPPAQKLYSPQCASCGSRLLTTSFRTTTPRSRGRGKHRMRSVITLMPAHSIAHSLSVPSAAVPAIPNPMPCPVLRRQGDRRENLHVLGHRRKRCRKPARHSRRACVSNRRSLSGMRISSCRA